MLDVSFFLYSNINSFNGLGGEGQRVNKKQLLQGGEESVKVEEPEGSIRIEAASLDVLAPRLWKNI